MVKSFRRRTADNFRVFNLFLNHYRNENENVVYRLRRRVRNRRDYWDSTWGRMLRDDNIKDPSTREGKDFQKRFRVPFPVYCKLVVLAEQSKLFDCAPTNRWGRQGVPIELKILGVLRILGGGWCMDDVSDSSGISEETMRTSFHTFNSLFNAKFYDEYVQIPSGDELVKTMNVYDSMGLTGCIGSMDGVHVIWDKCPVNLTNLCKGKEKIPTLVYNATVSHTGRIQACTKSFWGARNDKTIVRYDKHIMDLKTKKTYDDIEYELLDEDGNPRTCKGKKMYFYFYILFYFIFRNYDSNMLSLHS